MEKIKMPKRNFRIPKNKAFLSFILIILFLPAAFSLSKDKLSTLYGNYLKGLSYFNEGKYKEALNAFKKAKSIDPTSSYIRIKIAFVLVRLGKLDEAEKELKEVKKLDPDNLEASLGLIFLYSYLGKNKKLEEEYGEFLEKAHELRPQDTKISEYLAQFYFYKKEIDKAITLYEAIVKLHPNYFDTRYLLGYLYDEKGERKKAIQTWKKILEDNPNHIDTLNALGYVYAEEGIELDKAEEMIKKALEKDPDNGAYLDSLGWVYFKRKEYTKAEEYLKRAISNHKDPVIYEHLGDLYIKLNDTKNAVEYYKKGLELNPDSKSLKEKISKYEEKSKEPKEEGKPDKKVDN